MVVFFRNKAKQLIATLANITEYAVGDADEFEFIADLFFDEVSYCLRGWKLTKRTPISLVIGNNEKVKLGGGVENTKKYIFLKKNIKSISGRARGGGVFGIGGLYLRMIKKGCSD